MTTNGTTITTVANHNNSTYNVNAGPGYSFTYTYNAGGGSCSNVTGCHGTAQWGVTVLTCLTCHNVPITRQFGRPNAIIAAVTTEFGLAWGHKASGKTPLRAAVTVDDCIVCHLEGVSATGLLSVTYHKNGNIDLRDPDGAGETPITNIAGGAFTFQRFSTSYAAGSRTGSATAETIPNIISQRFCLRCHDATGALNTTARTTARTVAGSQYMPFGGVGMGANYTVANGAAFAGGLINAAGQFATTNSSKHPVLGPLTKDYPTPAKMLSPFNTFTRAGTSGTKTAGFVMNCFDCHNTTAAYPLTLRTVTAHGNGVTLRGTINGALPTLCSKCHTGYNAATAGHGNGSAFGVVDNNMDSGPIDECFNCHASTNAPVRPARAQDVHGVNTIPAAVIAKSGRWLAGGVNGVPIAFIRNTSQLGNHNPRVVNGTTYSGINIGCNMGCRGTGTMSPYTPGGTY